jgi:hypothetical protein
VVPPEGWFHQHFNSSAEPARYLALKILSRKYKLQPGKIQSDVPLAYGGWQIEYEDEDPIIRKDLRRGVRQIRRRSAHAAGSADRPIDKRNGLLNNNR